MGFVLSILFGFIPMLLFAWILYWLDRYEKEPTNLLGGVFMWGAVIAAGSAFVLNSIFGLGIYLFTNSEIATEITTGSLIAPIVEESLKGFAVFIVYLVFREEFDSVLDGMIYAGITALGFAATENVYYIYNFGFLEGGYEGLLWLVVVRVLLLGWQHPFYTAFIGVGLAIARLKRAVWIKLIVPVIAWSLAVVAHSFHNTMAALISESRGFILGTILDWTGWIFMFVVLLWSIRRERQWIEAHLKEEVDLGIISRVQYQTACSAWAQSAARFLSLGSGKYRETNRFYQLSAELAFKKQQRANLDEGNNRAIIEQLRLELAKLAPEAWA